jgi:hypothetical protein
MMESIRALLHKAIDYAGLFPPAGLDLTTAAANFARYQSGPDAWMLGRFVLTAAQVVEFGRIAGRRWPLSVLAGEDPAAALASISECDAIEMKIDAPDRARELRSRMPPGVLAFFEIPIASDPQPFVETIAACGGCAKARTGGVSRDSIPSTKDLARFIARCAACGVRFKATAGLHHALRGSYALTCEPDSPRAAMHGFLNVFAAACFAHSGLRDEAELADILEQQFLQQLRFDDGGIAWRGKRVGAEQIRAARANLALSFGSCSFEEPVADLRNLGLL